MPPKKAPAAAAKAKAAPSKSVAVAKEPAKPSRASSGRKASIAVVNTVTKTTITKTTKKRKLSEAEAEDDVPAAAPASKRLKSSSAGAVAIKSQPAAKTTTSAKAAPTVKSKMPKNTTAAPEKAVVEESASESEGESEGEDEDDDEPAPKNTKAMAKAAAPGKTAPAKKAPGRPASKAASKAAAPKAAPTKVAKKAAPKGQAGKKVVAAPSEEEEDEVAKPVRKGKAAAKKATPKVKKSAPEDKAPAPKKATAPKKAPAPRKVAAPKPKKALPIVNTPPTQVFDIMAFGEGSAGELGLGARTIDGKRVIDVTRPRLNPLLSAKDVGVVQMSTGGMHCIALTKDNKILTWGVNDQGALGRETPNEGKMVNLDAADASDSDSDSDDDSGLNPNEATPKAVDPAHFPEGTIFASVCAGDSVSFALTNTGLVYGWGTFRGNDGVLGFTPKVQTAYTPILIPELKDITALAAGTNHVLALNQKGKVFAWGAGEQSQLARRVVARTAKGALVPREFGLGKKNIVHVGCGDYHSFAVDNKGDVYSWGLNSFGQTGVPKDQEENDSGAIANPTKVSVLDDYDIKQVTGGAHHSIACTTTGQVLVWGRVDNSEGGMEIDDMPKDHLFFDEETGKPRYLVKPLVIPNLNGVQVSSGPDTCIAVASDGKAYSWGFGENYQHGQGHSGDVKVATWIDNSAVRDKQLVWSGVGGQFGMLAAIAEDTPMVNGI